MTVTVNSRVKILDVPVMAPGVCALCGSATKPVVDFGKSLDWYGAVYFCVEDCLREISEAMGYIPVAKFEELHDEYRKSQIAYAQLLKKYESVSNALSDVLSNNHSSNISNDNTLDDVVPVVEESSVNVESNDDSVRGSEEAEQSIGLEGSDDLFDSSDFD